MPSLIRKWVCMFMYVHTKTLFFFLFLLKHFSHSLHSLFNATILHYLHYYNNTALFTLLQQYCTIYITTTILHYLHYYNNTALFTLLQQYCTIYITTTILHYLHYLQRDVIQIKACTTYILYLKYLYYGSKYHHVLSGLSLRF